MQFIKNKYTRSVYEKRKHRDAAKRHVRGCSKLLPFIRISSLGTLWKSLWYCALYLLTVWEAEEREISCLAQLFCSLALSRKGWELCTKPSMLTRHRSPARTEAASTARVPLQIPCPLSWVSRTRSALFLFLWANTASLLTLQKSLSRSLPRSLSPLAHHRHAAETPTAPQRINFSYCLFVQSFTNTVMHNPSFR